MFAPAEARNISQLKHSRMLHLSSLVPPDLLGQSIIVRKRCSRETHKAQHIEPTSGCAMAASQMVAMARDLTLSSKSCSRSMTASKTWKACHHLSNMPGDWAEVKEVIVISTTPACLSGLCDFS